MRTFSFVFMFLGLLLLPACLSNKFDGPERLAGDKWIPRQTLNLGHDTYMQYCMQCHGLNGDGKGPAAYGMNPQPRDFTQGIYKFGSVASGELPTDEDLRATIRYGLKGTAMLPWDLSDERLDAVVQYIKTFSPVWKTTAPGVPQPTTPDPFGAQRSAEAIALGKKVYHGMAQCYSCHRAYAPLSEISAYSKELTGNEVETLREKPELSVLQDSSYGHKFMPPDFTLNPIKTGGDIASLYRVLGTGIGGTTMPAWKGALSSTGDEKESEMRLWALAYYVSSLHELKYDAVQRKKFFETLNGTNRSTNQ